MRILQVVHRAMPQEVGGTEAYTAAIARALMARGHECAMLAGTEESPLEPRLVVSEHDGMCLARYASALPLRHRQHWTRAYDPSAELLIRRFLTLARPELVHVHHWMQLTANIVGLCAEQRIPAVVTLHDLWLTCPRGLRFTREGVFCTEPSSPALCLNCAEREAWQDDAEIAEAVTLRVEMLTRELEMAACLLVPSWAQKALLQKVLGSVGDRLRVLPHGSIVKLPARPTRPAGGFPRRPLQIGYWGHLLPHKGPHLLIEAVRRLPDHSRVEVHLYGGNAPSWYQARLEAAAAGLPVNFHGPYSPADLARADLDLVVFPSLAHESYSFVLDEAFRCGLPVIVPDRGALPERAGPAGLVFPAEDPAGLAARIMEILDQPELLDLLRAAIPPSPSPPMEVHVEELERIYEEALAGHRPKRFRSANYPRLLEHAVRQVTAREAKLEELTAEVRRLEEVSVREREQQATRLAHFQQETDRLTQELAHAREERDRLMQELTSSREAGEQFARELSLLREETNRFMQELIHSREQTDRLTIELTHSRDQTDRLTQELAHAREERDRLMQELTASREAREQLARELTHFREQTDRLTQELTDARQERERLTQDLTHSRTRSDRLTQELAHFREQNDRLTQQIAALQRTPAFKLQALMERLSRPRAAKL